MDGAYSTIETGTATNGDQVIRQTGHWGKEAAPAPHHYPTQDQAMGGFIGVVVEGATYLVPELRPLRLLRRLDEIKRVPNPYGSRGGPAHRAKIQERIDALKRDGHEHIGGGDLPEEVIPTPGGEKSYRRPDITTNAPDGSVYRENVGRSNSDGSPIARERRSLDDIESATGSRPGYTPYDR
jgi:hypothetical protein